VAYLKVCSISWA